MHLDKLNSTKCLAKEKGSRAQSPQVPQTDVNLLGLCEASSSVPYSVSILSKGMVSKHNFI